MDYNKRQSDHISKKLCCSELKNFRPYSLSWDSRKNTWGENTSILQPPIIIIIIIIIIIVVVVIIENFEASSLQCLKI
jgi:hypothetical protein